MAWTLIDTETDGLSAPIHIIELAAQRFEGLNPVGDPFRVFLDHQIDIPALATVVHGYTTEFIRANGIPPRDAYAQFRAYTGDNPVVAHYIGFDWNRALVPELARIGEAPIGRRGFCSWAVSRRALPDLPTHRLDFLRHTFQLKCCRPHSALGDVESVTDLFTRILFPLLGKVGYGSISAIAEFSQFPLLVSRAIAQGHPFEEAIRLAAEAEMAQKRQRNEERRTQLASWKAAQEREDRLEAFLADLGRKVEGGGYSFEQLAADCHFKPVASIDFPGRRFLITGKLALGPRSKAEKAIVARGGFFPKSKCVASDLDYLVLGEDAEAGWTSRWSGKLRDAVLRKVRDPLSKLKIVPEQDLAAAFEATSPSHVSPAPSL